MPRRKPVQARATARRDSLLVAAARLLEREGYDSVTTNAIATEARTSVGTVYVYFKNKEEILAALLARYQDRLEAALGSALGDAMTAPIDDVVDRTVRTFATFYASEPGYAELWLGSQLVGPLRDAGAAWGDHFGNVIAALLAARLPLEPADAEPVALALVHAVSSVVTLALQHEGAERDRLVDQAVCLAQGYLARAAQAASG